MRKLLAILLTCLLALQPALATSHDFQVAEEQFRANPKAAIPALLDLASNGNLRTTGYLSFLDESGLLAPDQARVWHQMPQSDPSSVMQNFLQADFLVTKVLMNLTNPKWKPSNPLFLGKKKWVETLNASSEAPGGGRGALWLARFAMQDTLLGKPNPIQKETAQFLKTGNLTPDTLLMRALRHGSVEAIEASADVSLDRLGSLDIKQMVLVDNTLRMRDWMQAHPERLNEASLFREALAVISPDQHTDIQPWMNSAMLGDLTSQKTLMSLYHTLIAPTKTQLQTARGPARSHLQEQLDMVIESHAFWAKISASSCDPEALLMTGETHFMAGEMQEARLYFSRLITRAPHAPQAVRASLRLAEIAAEQESAAADQTVLEHTDHLFALLGEYTPEEPGNTTWARLTAYFLRAGVYARRGEQKSFLETLATLGHCRGASEAFSETPLRRAYLSALQMFLFCHTLDPEVRQNPESQDLLTNGDPVETYLKIWQAYQATMAGRTPSKTEAAVICMLLKDWIAGPLHTCNLALQGLDFNQWVRWLSNTSPSLETHETAALFHTDSKKISANPDQYIRDMRLYVKAVTGLTFEKMLDQSTADFMATLDSRNLSERQRETFAALLTFYANACRYQWISPPNAPAATLSAIKKASRLGNQEALYHLSFYYQVGAQGIPQNWGKASTCLECALQKGAKNSKVWFSLITTYAYHITDLASQGQETKAKLYLQKGQDLLRSLDASPVIEGLSHWLSVLSIHTRDPEEVSPHELEEAKHHAKTYKSLLEKAFDDTQIQAREGEELVAQHIALSLYMSAIHRCWDFFDLSPEEYTQNLQNAIARFSHLGIDLANFLSNFCGNSVEPSDDLSKKTDEEASGSNAPTLAAHEATAPIEALEAPIARPETLSNAPSPEVQDAPTPTPSKPAPKAILTKALLDQFHTLFNGHMKHQDIMKLIQNFDEVNGTNLYRFFCFSHKPHGRGDLKGMERNRQQSAIKLFEERAGITEEDFADVF